MDRDVLSMVSGEIISAVQHSLPDAASSKEDTPSVVVELADGLRPEVTFARLRRSPNAKFTQHSSQCGPALVLDAGERAAHQGMKLRRYNRDNELIVDLILTISIYAGVVRLLAARSAC